MKCTEHANHAHTHSPNCGHKRIQHGTHVDFLHDGHLHHNHGAHVDEHRLEISVTNPDGCKPMACTHTTTHAGDCPMVVPHGDHFDFVFFGRLHHVHGDHCDDHGPITVIN